ncbi:MBL fold metallo-hydrolase [Acidovorax cavernicola]|uniref:MBL fold metallo-hydrolase n=1 Tax=Acidovorax cavernicola TaxID=1675792 RepID=A0A9X8CYI0_9BURK|nr:MBL fold metallo-hydrolase [Acidovorax cavernicola]RIX71958.1 MBL fold metallo-hydrolase [Acidovorax cavernicola]
MKFRTLSLQTSLAVALALGGAVLAPLAHAAAPMVKTQAPGFHRLMIGSFEVTALSDGTTDLPAETLLHSQAHDIPRQLKAHHWKTSVTGYLVNTGDKLVLIDTGTGALMGPRLGKLDANLRAAGYQPDQVDDVLLTHAHPDHLGGLMVQGKMAFPNATIHMEQAEVTYWMSPERMEKAQAMERSFFAGAIASLTAYSEAGRLKPFNPGADLVPGIKAITAHGHTVGHTVFAVQSRGERLLVIGDLIHVGAVQLHDPAVTIAFDSDEKAARATRLKFFNEAARDNTLIAATHLSFPGVGRLSKAGKSFRWMPIEYSTQLR